MRSLYKAAGAGLSVDILSDPDVRNFIDTHASILDSSFKETDMSDQLRRQLESSDWIFSGMKTFHELNEAFPSLLDGDGNLKSFERFLNDVRKIDKTYNANYLRAEYNFVTASAEMAAKWEGFIQDGDRYNLRYRTQKDERVRPEHAALDGVTLPPSDPFWEEFYPPNGWNCRCTVVQVRKSKYPATPHDEAMRLGEEALVKDKRRMFRFNPGKEGKSVPDYNPYTISKCRNCEIPNGNAVLSRTTPSENDVCAACRWIRKCQLKDSVNKKGNKIPPEEINKILSLPYDEQFLSEYRGSLGVVYQHILHCTANIDHQFVFDVAKAFADLEGDCWINPVVRDSSPLRDTFYSDLPAGSKCNPDLKTVLFGYIDVKSPQKEPKMMRNAIHASQQQHSIACITDHRMHIDMETVHRRTNLLFKDSNYKHDYVFWYIDGKLLKYKRP